MSDDQPQKFLEGIDYTIDERGRWVFTADYLRRRGTCCGSGCRNCPYGLSSVQREKLATSEDAEDAATSG